MALLQLSAADLVRSGRLSGGGVVLLPNEVVDGPAGGGRHRHPRSHSQQRLTMENAARLALLVTRSFVGCFETEALTSNDGGGGGGDALGRFLAGVNLADFVVDLEERCVDDDPPPNADASVDGAPVRSGILVLGGIENRTPVGAPFDEDSPTSVSSVGQVQESPMQILGRLLYSIFSQGVVFHEPILPRRVSDGSTVSDLSDVYSHSSRRSRTAEDTLSGRLVDRRVFPLSVCRLLSDMMDPKADSPFVSVSEVMEDLDQMIAQPATHLHDSYYPYYGEPGRPTFGGQGFCYGRKDEFATLMGATIRMEQSVENRSENENGSNREKQKSSGVEAVFVSGLPGQGKSHLVLAAEEILQELGWIVTKAKFERGKEYVSGGIVASMFDKILSHLVQLKKGGKREDVSYCEVVSNSILETIGLESLRGLAGFLPSLPLLFDGIRGKGEDAERLAGWQLIYPLSKIIEAVLSTSSDRFMLMCCDDLQWCDSNAINLLSEVLMNVGGIKHVSRRLLFVGLYRDDEVQDDHPFSTQLSLLLMSSAVNATEIKLSGLSKVDIADMIGGELKLPRRKVEELADLVQKRTSGHPLFATELLNSLLNDGTIMYSSQKHGYFWDADRLDFVQTDANVAEFLTANFESSLSSEFQRILKILSCFGIQTDFSLLQILDRFQNGMLSSIEALTDKGYIDRAGPIVIFSHDLIQQSIYESMTPKERQELHLELGEFLGQIHRAKSPLTVASATAAMDEIKLEDQSFFAGTEITSSLLMLACDQVDFAGPESVKNECKRLEYASWNVKAGKHMKQSTNFSAAKYYFSKGIEFLGDDCWQNDRELCFELHHNRVAASFALGEHDDVIGDADIVANQVSFDDYLEVFEYAHISLFRSGRFEEGISRSVEVLRRINIELPTSPTAQMKTDIMARTERIVSLYSIDDIVSFCGDETKNKLVKVLFATLNFLFGTPLAPFLGCEAVMYCMQHGLSPDSSGVFVYYAATVIEEGDFCSASKWGTLVRAIMDRYKNNERHTQTSYLAAKIREVETKQYLYMMIDPWYTRLALIVPKLQSLYSEAMKVGRNDIAAYSLNVSWTFRFLGGENLLVLFEESLQYLQTVAKLDPFSSNVAIWDCIVLMELTGKTADYFSAVDESICNMDDLEAYSDSSELPDCCKVVTHVQRLMIEFWKGDYIKANEHTGQVPSDLYHFRPYHHFFGALTSYKLHRLLGEDEPLEEGKAMSDLFGKIACNAMDVFGNKWLLLQAEHAASTNQLDEAKTLYEASIKDAQDHGRVHDAALSYELLGDYYVARGNTFAANKCYNDAHTRYIQWGALAVASRLSSKHNLGDEGLAVHGNSTASKRVRSREWD